MLIDFDSIEERFFNDKKSAPKKNKPRTVKKGKTPARPRKTRQR